MTTDYFSDLQKLAKKAGVEIFTSNYQTYHFACKRFETRVDTERFDHPNQMHFHSVTFIADGISFFTKKWGQWLVQYNHKHPDRFYVVIPKLDNIEPDEQLRNLPDVNDPNFETELEKIDGTAIHVINHSGYAEVRMYRHAFGILPRLGVPLDQPLLETPKTTLYQSDKRTKSLAMWEYLKQRPMGGLRPKSE